MLVGVLFGSRKGFLVVVIFLFLVVIGVLFLLGGWLGFVMLFGLIVGYLLIYLFVVFFIGLGFEKVKIIKFWV